mmetsp:Transcript_33741/g.39071  ORF Transcript_33741/g.39071 Transcript_33741/m.39071 type:complete len:229 (-) Transcript_33741:370-1056(-)
MLIEPTRWNLMYQVLQRWHSQYGDIIFRMKQPGSEPPEHVRKRHGLDQMAPEEKEAWIKRYKKFSIFLKVQRQNRRRNLMEPYKVELLNRLGIDWSPKIGPGLEMWALKYDMLKKYSEEFGNCNVPRTYNKTLHIFMSSCRGKYNDRRRHGFDKDLSRTNHLTDEQIALLEAIGMEWGELLEKIPWEEHFKDLCRFKEKFGHPHVRWRDPERIQLANWVVFMRNKYMD